MGNSNSMRKNTHIHAYKVVIALPSSYCKTEELKQSKLDMHDYKLSQYAPSTNTDSGHLIDSKSSYKLATSDD